MRKQKKNSSSTKFSKVFLILITLFIILLIVFLFLQLDLSFKLRKEIQSFDIPDSCGIIGGDILHEFNTIDDCKLRCSNLCEVRDLNYFSHEFFTENRTCFSCECKCK